MKGTTEKFINQKGGFHGSLIKVGLSIMKNVITPLAKNIFLPLGIPPAAAAATDAAIQKKYYGLDMTTLSISNEEIKGIMEIVKSLEQSDLLGKVLAKQLKMNNKKKE